MIEFVSVDPKTILNEMVADYEAASGEVLYPGDERHLFLSQMAAVVAAARGAINDAANQNLIPGARGEALDAIGKMFDVQRLLAESANCILRFSVSPTQVEDILIPEGTRATPDGTILFATTVPAVILRGESHVDVDAQAMTPGTGGNGFRPGQIKLLADPIPYISVSNTTETSGGADEETDSAYEERIRLSCAKTSTAGAAESYLYWARSASAQIADVSVSSPSPGQVKVTVLPVGGGEPDEELLDLVEETISGEKVRPLTDQVTVAAPTAKEYSISLTYWISSADRARQQEIEKAAAEAVESFAAETGARLGMPINPDSLRQKLLTAGACRIDLVSPEFTPLQPEEAPVLTGEPSVTFGGVL